MNDSTPLILAIESSCDETSAAVLRGTMVLSNIIASQKVHEKYGGVVPELASRAHQVHIVPVVDQALKEAGIQFQELDAIACTVGPGLNGALLVGLSYAKSLSLASGKPLIAADHMKGHILAHYLYRSHERPPQIALPMLCLTVSGGHTQIVLVKSAVDMKVVGKTIDDAAGEAFDKAAKVLGLPYPGGPLIDKWAQSGNARAFPFKIPETAGLDYSFSGLKTSLLYFIQEKVKENPDFIQENLANICASYQATIIAYLIKKMNLAIEKYKPAAIALAGGVSANSALRTAIQHLSEERGIPAWIPPLEYTTDNAAMIGATAYFDYQNEKFSSLSVTTSPRLSFG